VYFYDIAWSISPRSSTLRRAASSTCDYCAPEHERSILWSDPALGLRWPLEGDPIVSEKDRRAPPLSSAERFD
jgi:dTDP-4-dehydrorhamnose 3,5-epimerase